RRQRGADRRGAQLVADQFLQRAGRHHVDRQGDRLPAPQRPEGACRRRIDRVSVRAAPLQSETPVPGPSGCAGPLAGIRVVDLTPVYAGPYCTFLLAQAGADVIKVEPVAGDSLRNRKGPGGAALPFAMLNANKRTVTLNLKAEDGRALLLRLL